MGRRRFTCIAVVAGGALAASLLVPAAATAAGGDDTTCTPSAQVTRLAHKRTKTSVVRKSSYSNVHRRHRARKPGRKRTVRAHVYVKMSYRVNTRMWYGVTAVIDPCTGGASSPTTQSFGFSIAAHEGVTRKRQGWTRWKRPSHIKSAIRHKRKAKKRAAHHSARVDGSADNRSDIKSRAPGRADVLATRRAQAGQQASALVAAVFKKVNQARANHGVPAYTYVPQIRPDADAWAQHISAGGTAFKHDPNLGPEIDSLGCDEPDDWMYWSPEEAIGQGFYGDADQAASQAVQAWMDSPHHRDILLSTDEHYAGVGVAHASATGWSIVFRTTSYDCSNLPGVG